MASNSPWSVPVRVEEVPDGGKTLHLDADPALRERIARFAGLQALPRLEADFMVTRHERGLQVTGEISATVGQTCGVTLEQIENNISETVDLIFAPGPASEASAMSQGVPETVPPEPLQNGCVDLGEITTEFLVLGIDPYPRKPGAVFAMPKTAAEQEGPFAALAALKGQRSKGDR